LIYPEVTRGLFKARRGLHRSIADRRRREVIQLLIDSKGITDEEVEIYRSSKYQVITVIPTDPKPTVNVYIFDQEELDHFLRSYSKYSEFVIAVSQVEALA